MILRRLMGEALAAAVSYGECPSRQSYSRMIRAGAIFRGSMLWRMRFDAKLAKEHYRSRRIAP